ncbi:3'-5' exonuclease, partial [Cutibacterium acnes]
CWRDRSTAPIIDLANTLLTHHLGKEEARFHNLGVKLRSQTGQGEPPIYRAFDDEASESAAIATWLRGQHDDGVPWSQMAILHRTNAQTAPLELALSDLDVPYVVKDAERFYERAEVKQALAALTRALQADPQAPGQRAREVLEDQGWTPQPPEGSGMVRQRWESLQALQEVAQSVS